MSDPSPSATAGAAQLSATDLDRVRNTIRLGFYVAEVRGRNRPGGPTGEVLAVPVRVDQSLPLSSERSATEQRVEAQAVLRTLAIELKLNSTDTQADLGKAIDAAAQALWETRRAHPTVPDRVAAQWKVLDGLIWDFDAHVQDELAGASDMDVAGYQLGRGLGECYWALDFDSAKGWNSWGFLLGPERCGELASLVGRLSACMAELSAPAIAGSLEVWKQLANDADWRRQPTVSDALYRQTRNWYELTVLGQDPTRLMKPYQLIKNWRTLGRAIRAFWPQLLVAGVSLCGVAGFAWLVSHGSTSRIGETLTAALGGVGLSLAGLGTRLKNETQALTTRLRQDAYSDLVAVAVTTAPPPHPSRRIAIQRAVRQRQFTMSTPTPGT